MACLTCGMWAAIGLRACCLLIMSAFIVILPFLPVRLDACDGALHCSLGGQLARVDAKHRYVIYRRYGIGIVWYNGLQVVDVE